MTWEREVRDYMRAYLAVILAVQEANKWAAIAEAVARVYRKK